MLQMDKCKDNTCIAWSLAIGSTVCCVGLAILLAVVLTSYVTNRYYLPISSV